MASELKEPTELATYLFHRLHQLGIRSVHGVPGDYNLTACDLLDAAGLHWVGNCNELNGGYAADGYARVNGISAMVTTYGVGELSAINAHAGAFAERTSIVHIVGSPALKMRQHQPLALHHTLGNGDFEVFRRMFDPISVAAPRLYDISLAPAQIDDALRKCWIHSQPIYIELPADILLEKVEGARLATPIDLSFPSSDIQSEKKAVDDVLARLYRSKRPCILVGMLSTRQRVNTELNRFSANSCIPTFATILTQGTVDETLGCFGGLYAGAGSHPGVQEFVEGSDLVLHFGPYDTDVTTFYRSTKLHCTTTVEIHENRLVLNGIHYPAVQMRSILNALHQHLDAFKLHVTPFVSPQSNREVHWPKEAEITHDWFWPYMGDWLEPGDIILTDTGTASFGIHNTRLPRDSTLINISLWASIGYSLPSAQGASLAAKEQGHNRRTVLFQGDGAFQLTCQELSTMIKEDLRVTIFLICNNGYTIERALHNTTASYNDIAAWRYNETLSAFGGSPDSTRTYQVQRMSELEKLLHDKAFSTFNGIQLVEVYMPELGVPPAVHKLASVVGLKGN